jgi:transcriptional regulator with XRE-family HTH domain
MNSIGKKIYDTRKAKGITQEELSELSKINLRTIQRIESNENVPRDKTLSLICNALEIDINDFQNFNNQTQKRNILTVTINIIYYGLLNLILMFTIGYLTLDSEANFNSRIGGFLLSFFIPIFIVLMTKKMNPTERVLKFGSGYISYIIMLFSVRGFTQGFQSGWRSGLFICLLFAIGVLFYGDKLIIKEEK